MNLEIKWNQPIVLKDGNDEDLIFVAPDIEEWDESPGVYMFCRIYGGTLIPLYIGRSKNVSRRIRQHINTTKMMKSIQKALNGEKVLVVGEIEIKAGQNIDASNKLPRSKLRGISVTLLE